MSFFSDQRGSYDVEFPEDLYKLYAKHLERGGRPDLSPSSGFAVCFSAALGRPGDDSYPAAPLSGGDPEEPMVADRTPRARRPRAYPRPARANPACRPSCARQTQDQGEYRGRYREPRRSRRSQGPPAARRFLIVLFIKYVGMRQNLDVAGAVETGGRFCSGPAVGNMRGRGFVSSAPPARSFVRSRFRSRPRVNLTRPA